MDDLISRAALLDEFRSLCGPQTGDGWDNMGVRNLIMRQKAVDAIPVEWLESKRKEALHEGMRPDEVEGVEMVLWMWQKEQEAR